MQLGALTAWRDLGDTQAGGKRSAAGLPRRVHAGAAAAAAIYAVRLGPRGHVTGLGSPSLPSPEGGKSDAKQLLRDTEVAQVSDGGAVRGGGHG